MSPTSDTQETSQNGTLERSEDDMINILVATDIHLGYAEKDHIRGQDTFVTFEEILKIAVKNNVDFVLLGGDLFHETRPTAYALYKCTELLKKYCLGDKPVQIEFLSDASHNFSATGNGTVNYEDPNLNVSLPVFSIHGNHDDPTGEQQISALNLLASTGLVNYFGKYTEFTKGIDIEPILLKKGETKLALFGLSHIKDERLGRMFLDKKVTVMAPPEDSEWFNLLVLHQNRVNRGVKTFIPDDSLPEVLDMVIWGHEHDCLITPMETENGVHISQPGSSVATSLAYGESLEKKVGILKVYKKEFCMVEVPLKTVRPFVYRDLSLFEELFEEFEFDDDSLTQSAKAQKIAEKNIEEMLAEAAKMERDIKLLPLIRLNITYFDEKHAFNAIRFGQQYIDRVANNVDMVKMKIASLQKVQRKKKDSLIEDEMEISENQPNRVEDLVMSLFENNEAKYQMQCLSLKTFNEAVKKTIDSGSDAIVEVTNHLIEEICQKLEEGNVEFNDVDEFIQKNKVTAEDEESLVEQILKDRVTKAEARAQAQAEARAAAQAEAKAQAKAQAQQKKSSKYQEPETIEIDSDSDEEYSPVSKGRGSKNSSPGRTPTRTSSRASTGSKGGRGSRGGRGGRKGKVF